MAKDGYRIIDSDMHIMEPPDLWQRYTDKKYRDYAQVGVTSENVRDLRTAPPGRQTVGHDDRFAAVAHPESVGWPQLRAQPEALRDPR